MPYTAHIERQTGELREFSDIRDAMKLPNGDVILHTEEGARLTIEGADIIRLKHAEPPNHDND